MQHGLQRPLSLGIHQVSYQPKEMGNRFPAISIISVYLISTYLCGFLWYMSQIKATTLKRNISGLTLAIVIGVIFSCFFSSVQCSRSVMSDSLRPHELQHARPPCPSPSPGAYPKSCPSSWQCHLAIPSPVVPFSSCPHSFPTSESFQVSQLFPWGGQSIGVWASASVLPMNTQDWTPLGWTAWISLQSKGLSRVFSNTTVQKHPFFGAQLSSQSNSHIQ